MRPGQVRRFTIFKREWIVDRVGSVDDGVVEEDLDSAWS